MHPRNRAKFPTTPQEYLAQVISLPNQANFQSISTAEESGQSDQEPVLRNKKAYRTAQGLSGSTLQGSPLARLAPQGDGGDQHVRHSRGISQVVHSSDRSPATFRLLLGSAQSNVTGPRACLLPTIGRSMTFGLPKPASRALKPVMSTPPAGSSDL